MAHLLPLHTTRSGRTWCVVLIALAAALASAVLFWLAFPGQERWYFAYIYLVPMLVVVVFADTLVTCLMFVLAAAVSGGMCCLWLLTIPTGSAAMRGLSCAALWHGLFALLPALAIHRAYHRLHVPMTVAAPLAIAASEYCEVIMPTVAPWVPLGLSSYRCTTMIQVADLAGVYGVSFVIAMVNGLLVDVALLAYERTSEGRRLRYVGVGAGILILLCVALYGRSRLAAGEQRAVTGPIVAAVKARYGSFWSEHVSTIGEALSARAEVVLLPEGASDVPLNSEFRDSASALARISAARGTLLQALSAASGSVIVTGASSQEKDKRYNSAFIYLPRQTVPLRYDKVRLVPFGEYIPLVDYGGVVISRLFGLSTRRCNQVVPGKSEGCPYAVELGSGRTFAVAVPICFEDCWPGRIRQLVFDRSKQRKADVVLSLTSDGSLKAQSEWLQHLAHSVLRAVEQRVAFARANTSLAAIISPEGIILSQSAADLTSRDIVMARVPLEPRYTFYGRTGDWFSITCMLLSGVLMLWPIRDA
jgi:apolipoprotein N-acyltransferase